MSGPEMIMKALASPGPLRGDDVVVFVEVRQQLPTGHRFEEAGVLYTVTSWQHRTRLGSWKIALVAADPANSLH